MSDRIKDCMWSVTIAFTAANVLFALLPGQSIGSAVERSLFQAFATFWVSRRISQSEPKS